MQQVASQERRIVELNKQLTDRNQTLQEFQTEKKTEMEALMSGMRQWIQNLDVKNEGHKQEFEKGLQRLVDTSSFDNGVWQVMCCASACAAKKEEDYQALKNQFEELNQQRNGGVFSNADDRVGDHDKLKPIVCESDPPEVPVLGDLGVDETIGGVEDIHHICTTFDCDEPSIIRESRIDEGTCSEMYGNTRKS
ncbi:hypothetical protein T484DRAFT_1755293 [Baffinella frigidus]|nr:hypothetical protein T484DRAFT_1755293 [Cryptophyta sp. CCMP2293]